MENKKFDVKNAAEALAPLLVLTAQSDTEAILQSLAGSKDINIDEKKSGIILSELAIFYIHLTDRFAFQDLGEKRNAFIDSFVDEVIKTIFEGHTAEGKKINGLALYQNFNEIYNKRQIEYGSYDFYPKEGAGLKGTLFWEFENKIAKMLDHEDDILLIAHLQGVIGQSVVKYRKLFQNFASEITK